MVLGIASVAISHRQLPFGYTITSRSTDVVVMEQPVQNINHSAFRSMFEREQLFGNNFNDWFRQLKLVLRVEKKMYVIEKPLPAAPAADSEAQVLSQWNAVDDAYNEVACLILSSMTPELHRQFENSSPYDMIKELKAMFEKQVGVERFDLIQTFHACKQEEGKLVAAYKAKKKSLKAKGNGKPNVKGNDKQIYIPKPKNPKPSAKEHLAKDDTCHHCKEVGHWKRNCPIYLAELLKKKKQVGSVSSSSIFTIELFAFPNKYWVYDTGSGTHICITKQGFRETRKLKQGALYLYVGNGVRAQVEASRSYDLVLPNVLVICLDNCHYAPSITRGVVSVHRLVENIFVQCFTDFGISVSKNNVHYFNAISSNGIYEIDMHNLVPNVNSIYNVSTKRVKHNLDSTYPWHCRLTHISKKRIKKLQQEGLLKSTNNESFDQCVSCLSGKMTRKSFPHCPERATDLLGIIHTDVCGPLKHVLRQGGSYFITFTNDYSRYGYVYLLKHKHEVFETFKVFKYEVENQLGKTIKAHRSDRGGEYISQEFKNYLKAYGIVQQLTPPYTLQHNGVSKRRKRNLLDMVRSMMNLTTLPHLDELHMTWAHLEKKQTRLQTNSKTLEDLCSQSLETASQAIHDVVTTHQVTTSHHFMTASARTNSNPDLEDSSYDGVWGCKALVKQDTPDKLQQRYAEFFEKNLITQEVSGRAIDLEEIQDEDTSPSKITTKIPIEVEGFKPPQKEVIMVRRSERTHRAPDRLCLNVEVEEHSIRDLNEPTSYKAVMLDSESNKWIDAMNAEIQSMMDNMVWVLVDLPPGYKTVGTKGYNQLYGVDYEETLSPVADIRSIRILISIAAYYDYEIWQMDVKTAFLNGYLDEDIYMVQPEGFIDPNHPRKACKL
ncbi:retrotransposon protein, putative, ty1-copia subclass [Tanacetum coccineum]